MSGSTIAQGREARATLAKGARVWPIPTGLSRLVIFVRALLQPFQGCEFCGHQTQGSSCLATLGWVLKPLWGWAAVMVVTLSLSSPRAAAPLSPDEALKSFRLADTNLVIELAAAEPDVRAPVAMAWDADGRLFVAEMTDYPRGPVNGRI